MFLFSHLRARDNTQRAVSVSFCLINMNTLYDPLSVRTNRSNWVSPYIWPLYQTSFAHILLRRKIMSLQRITRPTKSSNNAILPLHFSLPRRLSFGPSRVGEDCVTSKNITCFHFDDCLLGYKKIYTNLYQKANRIPSLDECCLQLPSA